jgi:hypothetical protein
VVQAAPVEEIVEEQPPAPSIEEALAVKPVEVPAE